MEHKYIPDQTIFKFALIFFFFVFYHFKHLPSISSLSHSHCIVLGPFCGMQIVWQLFQVLWPWWGTYCTRLRLFWNGTNKFSQNCYLKWDKKIPCRCPANSVNRYLVTESASTWAILPQNNSISFTYGHCIIINFFYFFRRFFNISCRFSCKSLTLMLIRFGFKFVEIQTIPTKNSVTIFALLKSEEWKWSSAHNVTKTTLIDSTYHDNLKLSEFVSCNWELGIA